MKKFKLTAETAEDFAVMLPTATDALPVGDGWLFEIKYDGYRATATADGGKTVLRSRNGVDMTSHFPHIAAALSELAGERSVTLDGEIVAADEGGRSDFSLLGENKESATFVAFDMPFFGGKDLRSKPLDFRKKQLEKFIASAPRCISFSSHSVGGGEECLSAAKRLSLEGIVAKRVDSPYVGGKSGDWLKLKLGKCDEFAVVGFCEDESSSALKSLLLGVCDRGGFVCVGRVGSGIGGAEAARLKRTLDGTVVPEPKAENIPPPARGERYVFVEPVSAVQVSYAELKNGRLRQPVYKGIRTDKSAWECPYPTIENDTAKTKANGGLVVSGVIITHPDRVIEPCGIAKGKLAEYYEAVGEKAYAFMRNRPFCAFRSRGGDGFFRKHFGGGEGAVPVGSDGIFVLGGVRGLIEQVQFGTVEFHVRGCRATAAERPDVMVFDFDPDEAVTLASLRGGVEKLKNVLDGLKLKSYLKTSGGKGYHVVVPLLAQSDYKEFSEFAAMVARLLVAENPTLFTASPKKAERVGKIYVDWQRNGRGATFVAPYSVRLRSPLSVSAPIFWSELNEIAPCGVDPLLMTKRIADGIDPWKDFPEFRSV